jgi:putative transposase
MDFTCFDHYARRQGFIDAAIGQLFLQGISTRKLKSIAQDLFGAPVSTGTVSNVASALDADLQVYQSKPLADDIVFLFLDGASQKVREIGLEGKVMLCAFGIHADGTKELLSFRLVEVEDTENGRGFLVDLKSRVLKGQALKLNIGDGKAALLRALREFYPLRRIQRCIAHKLRNVVGKMKRALRAPCMAEAKRIFGAPSRGEAIRPFKGWRER